MGKQPTSSLYCCCAFPNLQLKRHFSFSDSFQHHLLTAVKKSMESPSSSPSKHHYHAQISSTILSGFHGTASEHRMGLKPSHIALHWLQFFSGRWRLRAGQQREIVSLVYPILLHTAASTLNQERERIPALKLNHKGQTLQNNRILSWHPLCLCQQGGQYMCVPAAHHP